LKILKKLRTASLNSEFPGSYKKSVINNQGCPKIKRTFTKDIAIGERGVCPVQTFCGQGGGGIQTDI